MPDVFVNYRTGDTEHAAATIAGALSTRFGKDRIFRASSSIPPGAAFDAELIHGVRRSGVLLALIGPRWAGHPALQRAEDWVRLEIQEAFLCDIRVVPVLIGRKTERPAKTDLPPSLARLADCQTLRYDTQNNENDLKHIGDALTTLVPELAKADREAKAEPRPSTAQNTMGGVESGTAVQTGTVGGNVTSVNGPTHGPVHIGPSNRSVHQSGDGANYSEGSIENIRQSFGRSSKDKDDDQ
ncbi:TIR domain-containing protein [Streptomyces sp. NPDC086554]|uniref:toll/interleukin-1 receptor domain-containing protein n=1 Tax=Streptomyces sp. NPDC086554 TaxID=3154864 RepID=UPI00342F236A